MKSKLMQYGARSKYVQLLPAYVISGIDEGMMSEL